MWQVAPVQKNDVQEPFYISSIYNYDFQTTYMYTPWPCKRNFSPWALDEQYIQLFSYTPMMLAYITYLMNNQSGEWVPVTSNEEYHML